MLCSLELDILGQYWPHSGDSFYMERGDFQARVHVDNLGEIWVDVRAIPEGGYFHTERLAAYRIEGSLQSAEDYLTRREFGNKKLSRNHNRVYPREVS